MFTKIKAAQERLRGQAHITPIMTSGTLNKLIGAKVYFKCENLQRGGAFKFRGAFNAISQLTDVQKKQGVICYSSGNHAQAVALVGQILGVQTTAVMPDTAPSTKKAATAAYGAHIVAYNPQITSREALAQELQTKYGYTLIPPFDHGEVIAGQGTAALELLQELKCLDLLLVPCGGGGLLSGSAIAAKSFYPPCRVIGIEPELANDATLSFHTKQLHTIHNPPTIADGTRTPCLGKITYPLVLKYVDDMQTVSEEAIMEAVRFLFFRMKLVVEPSGALGLAALLSGAIKVEGSIGVILSGGNIDAPTMSLILKT